MANDPIDVFVGARIRATRKRFGVSQQKLADAIGVTFQQVQKYERGANRISASMMMRAARSLGVRPGDFFPDEDAPPTATAPDADLVMGATYGPALVTAFLALPQPMRRTLVNVAEVLVETADRAAEPQAPYITGEAAPLAPAGLVHAV